MLRNHTNLRPTVYNSTRWSGRYEILQRFNQNRQPLIDVADKDDAHLTIKRSLSFENRLGRYISMLKEIEMFTKILQEKKGSLEYYQAALDSLLEAIEEGKMRIRARLIAANLVSRIFSP